MNRFKRESCTNEIRKRCNSSKCERSELIFSKSKLCEDLVFALIMDLHFIVMVHRICIF